MMHENRWDVLLSGCLLLFSCAHTPSASVRPTEMEERIAAYEAEMRIATIDELTAPIFLGIYPGASLPLVFQNLTPEAEEGLAYWEWVEVVGEGIRKPVKAAYGKLNSKEVEFPFAKELDFSRIYAGIGIHLTLLYKKSTGEWIQRLVLPGILIGKTPQEEFKRTPAGALRYEDEHIQLIDADLIPAAQRDAVIANTFEMILLP